MSGKKLMRVCSGAHDRCDEMHGDCPYCDDVWPLRYEDGRFAPWKPQAFDHKETDAILLVNDDTPEDY